MNTQPKTHETWAERAARQSHAVDMAQAGIPAIAKWAASLLEAMPDSTPWAIRFRARFILQELETLQSDIAKTLEGNSR